LSLTSFAFSKAADFELFRVDLFYYTQIGFLIARKTSTFTSAGRLALITAALAANIPCLRREWRCRTDRPCDKGDAFFAN